MKFLNRLFGKKRDRQVPEKDLITKYAGGAAVTDSEGGEWRAHWSGDLVYLSWDDGLEQVTFPRDEFGKFIKAAGQSPQ